MRAEFPKKPPPDDPRLRPWRRRSEPARPEDQPRRPDASAAEIAARIEGMNARRRFSATLLARGCNADGVAAATREVTIAATGHTPRELRALKGLPESANVRDHMTEAELIWIRMAESDAVEAVRSRSATGNAEVVPLVRVACAPAMAARLAYAAAKSR